MMAARVIVLTAFFAWTWGWGYCTHDARGGERFAAPFWPILAPTARLYEWWVWGPRSNRRHVYTDRRWWQRGDRERRPDGWR